MDASRSPGDELADESLEDRVEQEKARALERAGTELAPMVFQRALRAYYVLGILIVDVQVVVGWYEVGSAVGLVVCLALAVYLEFLLYRYLWSRPRADAAPPRGQFRPTWVRPSEYGRWTPEADLVPGRPPDSTVRKRDRIPKSSSKERCVSKPRSPGNRRRSDRSLGTLDLPGRSSGSVPPSAIQGDLRNGILGLRFEKRRGGKGSAPRSVDRGAGRLGPVV